MRHLSPLACAAIMLLAGCTIPRDPRPDPSASVVIPATCMDGPVRFPLRQEEDSSWGYHSISVLSANGTLYDFHDRNGFQQNSSAPSYVNISRSEALEVLTDIQRAGMANETHLTLARKAKISEQNVAVACGRVFAALHTLPEDDANRGCWDGSDVTYVLENATLRDHATIYCGGVMPASSNIADAWCFIFDEAFGDRTCPPWRPRE